MNQHHILVGSVVVALCLVLLTKERWFLENTAKGQRLKNWFGSDLAPMALRLLIAAGIIFGVLLAVGVIRPIQWS